MTKQEYAEYRERVARYLNGLEAVSTGPCPGCEECGVEDSQQCAEEPWFSWSPCEICSGLAGDRVAWHAINPDDGNILHGTCCVDCMYFLEYGQLDDSTMLQIAKEE